MHVTKCFKHIVHGYKVVASQDLYKNVWGLLECTVKYFTTVPLPLIEGYVIPPSNNVKSLTYLPAWSLNMLKFFWVKSSLHPKLKYICCGNLFYCTLQSECTVTHGLYTVSQLTLAFNSLQHI